MWKWLANLWCRYGRDGRRPEGDYDVLPIPSPIQPPIPPPVVLPGGNSRVSDDSGDESDEPDSDSENDYEPPYLARCWSCGQEFPQGEQAGFSVDDTDEEQVCRSCWSQVPVSSRIWIGLLFRRMHQGGFGIQDLIADAMRAWPFSQRPISGDDPDDDDDLPGHGGFRQSRN